MIGAQICLAVTLLIIAGIYFALALFTDTGHFGDGLDE